MEKKDRIIFSLVGIFLVLIVLIGITYAYFLTNLQGNKNDKSIEVTAAELKLVYGDDDSSILGENKVIKPGVVVGEKYFTVTNAGTRSVNSYAVIIEDFSVVYAMDNDTEIEGSITKLDNPEDMHLVIKCINQNGKECNGYDGSLPTSNAILLTNSIDVDEVHEYNVTLTYKEIDLNQSEDMNKHINGKFNIIDTASSIDIEGFVKDYEINDYIEIDGKSKSQINEEGLYKIIGLEPGEHILNVCSGVQEGCENPKISKTIIINKGNESLVDKTTNTITMNDESRIATIDIYLNSNEIIIHDEIKNLN